MMLDNIGNAQVRLTGRVVTSNGVTGEGANIVLLNKADSAFIAGAITDGSGAYVLDNIAPGSYKIQFSLVGYNPVDSLLQVHDTDTLLQLGTSILLVEATMLNAVVVKAEKPLYQQKAEGLIVNIENNIMTRGSTALELLARSPGVMIDQRNSSIALNGKTGVTVMLNGKTVRMSVEQVVNFLSTMTGNNIEKIELLTTPPAGYDAEGGAGVINIVLKKNKQKGTTGSLTFTGGYGKYEKATAGGNIQYANDKINAYASYTYSYNHLFSNMNLTSEQYMPFMGGDVYVNLHDSTKAWRRNHDVTAGLDLFLNKSLTLGINSIYNSSSHSGATVTSATYNILPDSLLTYYGNNSGTNRWNNSLNSIYLEKKLTGTQKISINGDYMVFANKAASVVQSRFTDKHGNQPGTDEALFAPRQKGQAKTNIQVWALKGDYSAAISKKWNFESGLKMGYTRTRSVSGIESWVDSNWQSGDQVSNNITMKETIAAAYASFKGALSLNWHFTGGLRYEYSNTDIRSATGENITSRKLGRFFPSLLFTKSLTGNREWQFSYTRRISRPSYNDLASYVVYSDPTAVYTGNPFLLPTITHNFKVGYVYGKYAASLTYSRDINAISRYQLLESPAQDMLLITPQNLPRQNYLTLQVGIPIKVNKWWSMNYNWVGGFRNYKVKHTKEAFSKSYFAYNLTFSQAFVLPSNFSAEISGWYNTRSFDGSKRLSGFVMLNAGIKKQLPTGKGSIQLAVSDILKQERYIIRYGTLSDEAFSIRNHVTVNTESIQFPVFKLTYSRSFGQAAKRKFNIQSPEESSRVRRE